jgi:cell wall-associated NlpC family hydrolase
MRERRTHGFAGRTVRWGNPPALIGLALGAAVVLPFPASAVRAAGAPAAPAVTADAWQAAARHQDAWIDATTATRTDAGWGQAAPPDLPAPNGGSPRGESLALPESSAPLLDFAATLLGQPYRFGSESGAYDCSGFVRRVFAEFGVDLPRSSRQQFTMGRNVARDALRPGDLVFFRTSARGRISHVGLYAGDGLFVHAARHAGRVRVDALDTPYFASHYAGARRLPLGCSLVNLQCRGPSDGGADAAALSLRRPLRDAGRGTHRAATRG